jgi:hypothetical protein
VTGSPRCASARVLGDADRNLRGRFDDEAQLLLLPVQALGDEPA